MQSQISALERARNGYRPRVPAILDAGIGEIALNERDPGSPPEDQAAIRERFPLTFGRPLLELVPGEASAPRPLTAGVVFSGGQAPGGHNVVAGLFDGLKAIHGGSRLYGFMGGPKGILTERVLDITADLLEPFRNTGGFDLLGSGRDKIDKLEQFKACEATCRHLGLDGLVIVGGDDSNTNAALLAERFLAREVPCGVIGVPKTIDGDLKSAEIELPFGFDTATRVYSELIGNICRDARSARKYWHFIRLMGRSASHVTVECALSTRPNVAIVAEEVEAQGLTLSQVVDGVAEAIRRRARAGKSYGVVLVPEGLIEFIPEMRELISELNRILAEDISAFDALAGVEAKRAFVEERLRPERRSVFAGLPVRIQEQLLIDRDAHGNVQVSKIDTELLLIGQVARRIAEWRADGEFSGKFLAQGHFFGYEGRAAIPSNFDADYTYALGRLAAALTATGRTGYVCSLRNLAAPPAAWRAQAVPLTSMMRLEQRRGKPTPVIAKALVRLDAEPFRTFAAEREGWEEADAYVYPGPIQYFGPHEVSSAPCRTLALERPPRG